MRSIAFVLATFVASAPAAAQGWQEYTYPDYAFAVAFPGDPQVESTTHQVAAGRSVAARVYSVRQSNVVFKMTVAELAGTNLEESVVIDNAIKTLSEGGKVKVDIPHPIYRVYGRQLAVEGADGGYRWPHCLITRGALSDEAKALPDGARAIPLSTCPFSTIADLYRRRLKPLGGCHSCHSRSLSRLGRRCQRRRQSR